MKSKNLCTRIKNALAMLVVLGSTSFMSNQVNAQQAVFSITDFSNFTFYTNNTSGEDLHYNYGWIRNNPTSGSNVFISGSNLVIKPTSGNLTNWVQTVAMNFSNSNTISYTASKSNNSVNTGEFNVYLIDTTSANGNDTTQVYTTSITNASSSGIVYITVDPGVYWVRFEYIQDLPSNVSNTPQLNITSMTFNTTPTFLPVNYLSFEANKTGANVNLKWITASETNNSHFEIERSQDTENWITLEQVQGTGNSEELISYEFTDANPLNVITYYRLKQVDYNGEVNYSELREVIPGTVLADKIAVYPNPANNFIKIDIIDGVDFVKTEIRSIDGRVYGMNEFQNQTQANISISHLTPGMYYIHIQMGDQLIVRPFVKQ